jgi:hypothetical protein
MLPLGPQTDAFAWVYLVTQPVMWFFYILIVLELYTLVLRNHQGIATLGRWLLIAALFIAMLVSLLTLVPDLESPLGPYPILSYYSLIERGVNSSLVVFLLVIVAFLAWYPIPLSRNVILHSFVFSVYFLSSTATLFVRNVTGFEMTRMASAILLAITDVCLLVWIVFLNRRGESRVVVLGHQWQPGDEERLVEQLDSINKTLLRSTRK